MPTVRRSMLFTPANISRFVQGVWKHSPDMVVLDLEDSVAPNEKVSARAMVQGASQYVARCGMEVAVRINHDTVADDCDAVVWPEICAVVLPKAESSDQIGVLDTLLTKLEGERKIPNRSVEIMPMIETALGVQNAYDIASSSGRIKLFGVLGEADLTAELGASFDALQTQDVLAYPRAETRLVARALGLTLNGRVWVPGKATIADYSDPEALERSMKASWEAGCRSTFCIHPRQVAAANHHLRPTELEVEEALKKLRVYIEADLANLPYGVLRGQIVNARAARAAQETIAYAQLCSTEDTEKARRIVEFESEQ